MNEFDMSWFDRFIGFFSPQAAFKRVQYRMATDVAVRKYEGASQGRRTKNWIAPGTDAEASVTPYMRILRNRSRDLVRNNPWANKALDVIEGDFIGTGIVPKIRNKNIQKLWQEWAETTDCDFEGDNNIYGLQALAMREIAEGGEVLIRRIRRDSSFDLSIPLQLQILEADYIDTTKEDYLGTAGPRTIAGIEYDGDGRKTAYWIFKDHPGSRVLTNFKIPRSIRVPAEEILHVFRKERSGQQRGIPWTAPVIIRTKDFDEYEDAQLVRQKIAACFAAFMYDSEAPIDSSSAKNPISEKIEPGSVEVLPPGKRIEFANPPGVGGDFKDYADITLHAIAAGMNIPYECLTGDYSRVNFSSGRMGWVQYHRSLEKFRYNTFIPKFCCGIWDWFMLGAELMGAAQRNRVVEPTWTPPRREMIDPTKEIAALKDAVRSGFKPLSSALRELGEDPDEVFESYRSDNQKLDELELILDSDPRNTNANGAQSMTTGTASESEGNSSGSGQEDQSQQN